ncbi:MAG: hypothetical protein ACR2MS_02565 [Weeksellaceae bacterium]
MSKAILIFILCIFNSNVNGQENTETENIHQTKSIPQNNINVELLGRSINLYSINYQRVFKSYENSYLSLSIGASNTNSYNKENRKSFPFSIFYTTHQSSNWHGEYGLGINYIIDKDRIENTNSLNTLHRASAHASAGIKYQKPTGGFNVKLAVTPVQRFYNTSDFLDLEPLMHSFGLTVGYAF